jgi:aminoglycoside phosphotransferase (APT) family kinase protein
MRQMDIDLDALEEIADRVLPGSGRPAVARMVSGVSTPVYRIERTGTTYYLRLAESAEASLLPEALVHERLRSLGVRVPDVVHVEPYNDRVGRSLMVTTAIPGRPLATSYQGIDAGPVLAAAGRDLAVINGVRVDGFGWVRRDRPESGRLEGEVSSLRAFALDDLDRQIANLAGMLSTAEIDRINEVVARNDDLLDAAQGSLAHGDFDATHIYHVDGAYSGTIDFGEIRGTDRWYDLGHFALHDGEHLPRPMLPDLLAGYEEVTPVPPDGLARIRFWSLLIGVRTLARIAGRPWSPYHAFLVGAVRRSLAEVAGSAS